MKKLMAGMMVAAAAIVASVSPSFAFQSVQEAQAKATATTGGTNTAAFTIIKFRSVAGNVDQSTWTYTFPTVDPLSASWTRANEYMVLNATVTDVGGGIKIYTDNTRGDASPKFVPPTNVSTAPTSVAAGLLKGTSGTTSAAPLPMAWSIKTSTTGAPTQANPQNSADTNSFQWLNLTDFSNWASGTDFNGNGTTNDPGDSAPLALNAKFPTMISNIGVHFGQADTEFGAYPDGQNSFVYMEANFAGADVLQAYQTNKIIIEAYIN
jgi:hypothetical protein